MENKKFATKFLAISLLYIKQKTSLRKNAFNVARNVYFRTIKNKKQAFFKQKISGYKHKKYIVFYQLHFLKQIKNKLQLSSY